MNKIVEVSPEIDEVKLNKAEECHKEVLARTIITANNLLELGKLFKAIRDERLYKLLGAETFGEYIGYPEISFGRSTIYSFIHVYELYVLRLGFKSDYLSKIGHRRLQIISPIVLKEHEEAGGDSDFFPEGDADFWLEKAETLSESDLINEVRRVQNKPPMIPKPKEVENVYPFSFKDYLDFVKAHPCIICGEKEVDTAHFPTSRGAGGRDTDCIPLCRKCHSEIHQDHFDWLWLHLKQVFGYFYDTFIECFELKRRVRRVK